MFLRGLSFISMKYCVTASAFLLWNIAFSFAFDIFIAQNFITHSFFSEKESF